MTRKTRNYLRIIINFGCVQVFELISKESDHVTIFDLKQIIFEMFESISCMKNGKSKRKMYEYGRVTFERWNIFFGLHYNDIIPVNRDRYDNSIPYVLSHQNNFGFVVDDQVRIQHKIYIGNKNKEKCGKCEILSKCFKVDKNNKDMQETELASMNSKLANKLYHLSEYNHFHNDQLQSECIDGINCKSYQRVVNNVEYDYDRLHLYLYNHPSRTQRNRMELESTQLHDEKSSFYPCFPHSPADDCELKADIASENSANMNTNDQLDMDSKSDLKKKKYSINHENIKISYFDHDDKIAWKKIENTMHRYSKDVSKIEATNKRSLSEAIVLLIKEVIENGFENDLQPNCTVTGCASPVLDLNSLIEMNTCTILIRNSDNNNKNINNMRQIKKIDYQSVLNILKKRYRIFDILKEKMDHPRHITMGSPLTEVDMLSLVLYTDGECNYNLCEYQRKDKHEEKWPLFDWYLNRAIEILWQHEIHHQNIYTGVCGVHFRGKTVNVTTAGKKKIRWYQYALDAEITFKSNVSFSSDLAVAKQFRGSNGMILEIDMKNSLFVKYKMFKSCNVAWISNFPSEKEILAFRGSHFKVKFSSIYMDKESQNQRIVCGDD